MFVFAFMEDKYHLFFFSLFFPSFLSRQCVTLRIAKPPCNLNHNFGSKLIFCHREGGKKKRKGKAGSPKEEKTIRKAKTPKVVTGFYNRIVDGYNQPGKCDDFKSTDNAQNGNCIYIIFKLALDIPSSGCCCCCFFFWLFLLSCFSLLFLVSIETFRKCHTYCYYVMDNHSLTKIPNFAVGLMHP